MSTVHDHPKKEPVQTFPARRPPSLVYTLLIVTEAAGIITLLTVHATIGWAMCAAPFFALLVTGAIVRPAIQITPTAIIQRQYPFVATVPFTKIASFHELAAAGRVILAYRLQDGIPPPRQQPVARLLRQHNLPYDGGFFIDTLTSTPKVVANKAVEALEEFRAQDSHMPHD